MSSELEALIARLNEPQREAVTCDPGPILILAGAGSGKTRVLTHRIAYMIEHRRINPWNILAVTFTNKASEEMAHRVMRLLPDDCESVQVTTFHKAAAQILRRHIDRLGYSSSYVIYDDQDQLTLLKRTVDELGLNPSNFDPKLYRTLIDRAKNKLQWPDQVEAPANGPASKLPRVYQRYQEKLKAANALDFGDLLLLTVQLLTEHEDVRQYYLDRYQHLLIDEYQDTNHAQYKMAQLLVNPHTRSICVVGDEDQSIYAFRGADINNILDFSKDYTDARVIKLEQNYRSTNMILRAATEVVANNEARIGKVLWTDRGDGEPLQYLEVDSDVEEASRVAEETLRLRSKVEFGDIAVLYRTNSQSRVFEEVFSHRSIPYLLVGQGFYDRKEIRDLRAYLQLLFNSKDDASLERILNVPARGIGEKAQLHLFDLAAEHRCSAWEALEMIAQNPSAHGSSGNRLAAFFKLMNALAQAARTLKVRELMDRVLEESGYRDKLIQAGDLESETRLENLKELGNVAAEFDAAPGLEGLQLFLERISLRSQSDELKDEAGRVTLMTIHNAKGLEFPVVFLVGMEDGVFPHSRTLDNPDEVEEERRLCYVGMTRAMNRLYLTRARRRRFQGEYMQSRPSRFLKEIPATLMNGQRGLGVGAIARRYGLGGTPDPGESASARPASGFGGGLPRPGASAGGYSGGTGQGGGFGGGLSRPGQSAGTTSGTGTLAGATNRLASMASSGGLSRPSVGGNSGRNDISYDDDGPPRLKPPTIRSSSDDGDPFGELQVGRRVMHSTLGEGVIREREGPADNPRLTIQFRSSGTKKVMARYGGLELIYR